MDFGPVATLALSTGLATALLNQGLSWLRETRTAKFSRRFKAAHLALRIAVALETFSSQCAEAISDNDFYESTGGTIGKLQWLPDLPSYPEDGEAWTLLDLTLSSEVLVFPIQVRQSRSIAAFQSGLSGPNEWEEVSGTVSDQCARLGHSALATARRLRERYSIASIHTLYNFEKVLTDHLAFIEKREQRQASRLAEKKSDTPAL